MEWQIRSMFNKAWEAIVARKQSGNKSCLSDDEYNDRLREVRQLEEALEQGRVPMSAKNYRFLRKYGIVNKGGREWLVKPSPLEGVSPDLLPMYVTNDEMFDVLEEAHMDTNHGNEDQMYNQVRTTYCNVTREAVVTYLGLCACCGNPRQVAEVRSISPEVEQKLLPMSSSPQSLVYGTSVYFGFVDMNRYACDGYSYIMLHWDNGTRFIHMVPLRSISHVHVAVSLLEIYATFGIPYFMDAPYDTSYIVSIIDHIKSVWCVGNSIMTRSSDDQIAMITGWNLIQKIMEPWVNNVNFQSNWPSLIKYLQYMMNKRTFSASAFPPSIISRSYFNLSV